MNYKLRTRHLIAVALGPMLACTLAGAQARGGFASARMSSAHVGSAARMSSFSRPAPLTSAGAQGIRHATVIRMLPDGRVTSSFDSFSNSTSFGSANGVPGLGFDYSHLAAISGSLQNNRLLRGGRGGRHGQGTFVPILLGGYPYYYDGEDYDQSQQQAQPQPQVIVIQQPAPAVAAQQGMDPENDAATQSSLSSSLSTPQSAPIPDVGDFILVRRDGRILFASAFSIVGAQLQYVSPEGIRHTLPMTELDANATQQMNEARGTTVQISN